MRHRSAPSVLLAVLALVAASCGGGDGDEGTESAGGEELAGVFKLDAGECAEAGVTSGTYFRMVQVGGKLGEGPYIENLDSPCGDKTFTPMSPGSDGGLMAGKFQEQAAQPFDAGGNGATDKITTPTAFFGVKYALATNETDPQTKMKTKVPIIMNADGKLSGDLRAFAATWNGQFFNQGSPKPNGEKPGLTAGPIGTYDPSTKKYTLDWSSQIVGDAFNNFTGVWHLEGTFEASS
jgi:hypothetical protein